MYMLIVYNYFSIRTREKFPDNSGCRGMEILGELLPFIPYDNFWQFFHYFLLFSAYSSSFCPLPFFQTLIVFKIFLYKTKALYMIKTGDKIQVQPRQAPIVSFLNFYGHFYIFIESHVSALGKDNCTRWRNLHRSMSFPAYIPPPKKKKISLSR